ncbi:MAG TPA: hypothetical protein VMH90_00515 [Thermoplasmata archaeon]|nr:hypothetical protein [Thermoplasmata archaeon]
MAGPTWAPRVLGALIMTTFVLLLLQLASGVWTNLTGPSTFTADTMFPALTAHYGVGYLLGILALLALVVTGLTRDLGLILPALLALAFIGAAGIEGSLFVRTAGNPDMDSTGMAVAFLLAFIAQIFLARRWAARRRAASAPAAPAASASG